MTPLDFHAQLLTELTDAAISQPLLVLVDDAHWLDDASTLALAFVLRRLDRDRVAVLAATRPTRRSWLQGLALVEIDLPGLDVGSAAALLDRAGQPDLDVVARCVAGTGGNPLALLELSRLLSDGQLLGDEPLPEPLPIGVTTEEAVNARLHEASAEAARAACLVAIEESGDVGLLQRVLRRTGLEWSSVDELERLRLIDIGDGVVSWTHPLHRLGAYHALPGAPRRELHRALADELVEVDPSRRAWHLRQAAIGPDESISAELAATAGELDRRGALNHAGSAYEWSAQAASDRSRRLDLLWSSADCFRRGGRLDDTRRVARRAVEEAPTATDTTRHILLLGEAETWAVGPGDGAALLLAHAERLADDDPLRPLVRCYAAIALLLAGEVGRMVEVAALDRPADLDPFVVTLSGLAHGHALAECGDLEHGEPEIDAARPLVEELIDVAPAEADTLVYLLAVIDIALERFRSTEALLRRLMAQSLRLGLSTGFAGLFLADILWRTGRWLESHALVSQLVDLSREEHQTTQQMAGAALLGRAEACLGRTVAGTRLAGEALEYASSTGNGIVASWARSALALSALAAGQLDEAHGHLDRLRGDIRRWGGDLPGVLWWQGDYLAVLIALQERRRAMDELERLRDSSQARSSRWVQATILANEARLSTDDPGPVVARAAELLAAMPAPFEQGRALLAWADHPGADDAGRSSARRAACQLFESLGAVPWAARALVGGDEEGGTEPVVESLVARLTPAELRVAVAVGSGESNKEVARRLFVSTKTVEFHLGHIYAKLGLSGRGGLIRLVAAESSEAERAAWRRPLPTAD